MPTIVKNIPPMDLASFLMETEDTPVSVGSIQILEPVVGSRDEVIARILDGYRNSEVDAPFNYVPIFPRFGMPKWAECDFFDADYHVRQIRLDPPGSEAQLLSTVMDLHEPLLDRERPGWIAYVIDGLENDRLAVYWKVQHAYIDGASALMRTEASIAREPEDLEVRPVWAPLFGRGKKRGRTTQFDIEQLSSQVSALRDVGSALARNMLQASGMLQRDMPLPFTAPRTLFNRPVHATRRLGVGTDSLERYKRISKHESVSINEVILTLIGHSLERYQLSQGEISDRPLVAVCPLATRDPNDTEAGTKIAAISVALGTPGIDIKGRLDDVHASSRDAKQDANQMSNTALMQYMLVMGGTAEIAQRLPIADYLRPSTNVNVSNVAGPPYRCYIGGAEVVGSYPVSTLAGGTAINITFASGSGRMDFAVIADAIAIPEPQRIADGILAALDELEAELGLADITRAKSGRKTGARKKAASKTKPKTKASAKKRGKPKTKPKRKVRKT